MNLAAYIISNLPKHTSLGDWYGCKVGMSRHTGNCRYYVKMKNTINWRFNRGVKPIEFAVRFGLSETGRIFATNIILHNDNISASVRKPCKERIIRALQLNLEANG